MPSAPLPPLPTEPEPPASGGLNFHDAIRLHQAWRGRLLAVVEGRSAEHLDASRIRRDHLCPLGHWLHHQARDHFDDEALLRVLETAHAHFHQVAGDVVRAVDEGQPEVARRLLDADFHKATVQVQAKLAELFLSRQPVRMP